MVTSKMKQFVERGYWQCALPPILPVLVVLLALQTARAADKENVVRVDINGTTFDVALEDNPTAHAFAALLPLRLEMEDLHGNEKYHNLNAPLPASPKVVGRVNAGDVMLFGDKCLVVFYKGFATPYRYTRIGRIHNAALLARVCGDGRIAAAFSKQ